MKGLALALCLLSTSAFASSIQRFTCLSVKSTMNDYVIGESFDLVSYESRLTKQPFVVGSTYVAYDDVKSSLSISMDIIEMTKDDAAKTLTYSLTGNSPSYGSSEESLSELVIELGNVVRRIPENNNKPLYQGIHTTVASDGVVFKNYLECFVY